MKKRLVKPVLGFLFMVLLGLYSVAQERNEAQEKKEEINVQITKEVDGEVKTYKKNYSSENEMQADEDLKDFIGKENRPFWFSEEDGRTTLHYEDSLESNYRFQFNCDQDFTRHFQVLQTSDSSMRAFELHMKRMSEELSGIDVRLSEQLQELRDEGAFAFSLNDEAFDFDFTFTDSLSEQVRGHVRKLREDALNEPMKDSKKLNITEEVDEFGKLGEVKKGKQLEVENLSYFPNPSTNGRFKLQFKTPGEGELSVKVFDLEGKEIFNRYFERYNGLFSEMIDLSNQSEGVYMLQVQMDEKRLTRKIAID